MIYLQYSEFKVNEEKSFDLLFFEMDKNLICLSFGTTDHKFKYLEINNTQIARNIKKEGFLISRNG